MKKKITLLALMLVLIATLAVLFVVSASAEDPIVVTYEWYNGSVWETAKPNEDGSYTLRTDKKSSNGTVTLANGTKVDKVFFGWYTKDGVIYEPGATVTFTENTTLYEAYGVEVNNIDDFKAVKTNKYVRLGADLVMDAELKSDWGMSVYDLNGHTLTVTNNNHALYNYRGAFAFIGKGTILHQPAKLNSRDDQTGGIIFQHHGHGDWDTLQRCFIGRDITFETPYNLFRITGNPNYPKCPDMHLAGTIKAKNFIYCGSLDGALMKFYDTLNLTLSGNQPFKFTNQGFTNQYADIYFGGTITITNPDAVLFDDFLMSTSFEIKPITSGKFTISSADAENLKSFVAETHMLKATENQDGTVTYSVVPTDCVHEWVVDEEATVKATLDKLGIDAQICTKCESKKQKIVAYVPTDVEISVTVIENGEEKTYTMLAGDVFSFDKSAKNGSKVVSKITDVIYRKNDIVKLEIPYGVELISIFSMTSLKELTFMDNSYVDFKKESVKDCALLEKIALGKSTVVFVAGANENTEAGIFANCPSLTTLDVSESNARFNNFAFASNKTIKYLNMGEGNTYYFGQYAFAHSSLKEVIIPDNAPTTLNKKSFAETESIEYIYVGANSISNKQLADQSSIFGGNSYLSKAVLMDIEYIGEWVLSTKKPGNKYQPLCDLVVYSHSENLSIHNASFNDRSGNYTVYLYTANANLAQAPGNCNYVVFKGIGHAYTESVIYESTCVTSGKGGYVTDCPCKIDYRENGYTTVSNKIDAYKNKTFEACGSEEYDLPLKTEHTLSDVVKSIEFENGFLNLGTHVYKCLYCNEAAGAEEEASFPALFSFNGYSVPENGELAISVGYTIFQDALRQYESIMGALEYGVVGAVYEKLNGLAPLAQNEAPVVKAQVTGDYASFDFVISGFKAEQMDLGLVMCAYVYDGTKYVYLQETQTENPTAVSINSIINA